MTNKTAAYKKSGVTSLCAALLAIASVAFIAPVHPSSAGAQANLQGKLNVLFITVDDLNTDLGCYGHPQVKSPHIDRLARRGVRFDRAYAQYTLCNPSRASFLSGRRPETTGIFDLQTPPRKRMPDAVFLPQLFRQHGYFTARFGKIYHDGRDDALSWDVSSDAESRNPQEVEAVKARYRRPNNQRYPEWTKLDGADADTLDGVVVHEIARLMEEKAKEGKPFFLAAGIHKPHLPWTAPRKYFAQYPPNRVALKAEPPLEGIPQIALMTELTGSPPPPSRAEAVAAYQACVTFADAQVGVLLAALDRLKLWDKTIVVLTSDHGFHLGDHGGLWAKLTLFERSARVPLIIAEPRGRQAGKSSPRTVELLDLYPTLAELCGLPPPAGLEGASLAPLLRDARAAWSRPAYTMVVHKGVRGSSVRTEDYRYTEWASGQGELYDHRRDPHESRNLAGEAKSAPVVAEMKRLLAARRPK
jgi:iduronate 2-sulfatase